MTQPTAGFGQTAPRPRRANASAARIERRSKPRSLGDFAASGGSSIAIRGDPPDKIPKILGLAEVTVDRCETDVGDLVEARQRFHHEAPDHIAGDIRLARALQLPHQRVDDALDPLGFDGAFTQCDVDRAGELIPIKGFPLSMLFYYGQFA